MSLSEQFKRVDGSQNDILKALAQSYGINTTGLKIDQIAAAVKASKKFKQNGLLSTATAGKLELGSDATPDDAFLKIKILIDGVETSKAQVVTGSYVGTGKYGEENKKTLTFDGVPVLVVVMSDVSQEAASKDGLIWVTGVVGATNGSRKLFSQSGNSFSWWTDYEDARYQLDASGVKYHYAAILK